MLFRSVSVLKGLLGGSAVGLKVITDIVLFFLSYKIQHKYIFKDDKKEEDPDQELILARMEKESAEDASGRTEEEKEDHRESSRSQKETEKELEGGQVQNEG